jgi:hypothetical protein
MKTVFADACYWIGLLNENDGLHAAAREASDNLGPCRIVTTEMVLVEVLNGLSGSGENTRRAAAETIRSLEKDPNVEIVPQTSIQSHSATERYASRLDKEWGATDCASFLVMEEKGLREALTDDHPFTQANFTILMTEDPSRRTKRET